MEFLFDDTETQAISAAAQTFRTARRAGQVGADRAGWQRVGQGGWLELGPAAGGGPMNLPLLAGLCREAGREMLGDQFVNCAFLLPALCLGIVAPEERQAVLKRLPTDPGFLLVDGVRPSLIRRPGNVENCFGADAQFDAYELVADGAELALRVYHPATAPIVMYRSPELVVSTATVELTGKPDETHAVRLDLPDTERLVLILHAAALAGLAEAMLSISTDYVKTRTQFGRPIGQFQAIKHLLADVAAASEIAWRSILYAAATMSIEPVPELTPYVAHVNAIQATDLAAKALAQVHGGFGFTWESEIHVYLKAAREAISRFGGLDASAALIGQQLVEAHD